MISESNRGVDRLKREAEVAELALAKILSDISAGDEAPEIARRVSDTHEIAEVTAFEIVRVLEEQYLLYRRRVAIVGNLLLGPGLAVAILGGYLAMRGSPPIALASGAFASLLGAAMVLLRGRIASRLVERIQASR